MAEGDPVLVGTSISGATFLLTAETGAIIQSSSREVSAQEREVFDASVGDVIGVVYFKFLATQNFSAIVNGVTGVTLAAPGVALALANSLGIGANQNGVAAGGLYTQTVNITHQGEDLRMISGTTKQRKGIA